MLKKRIIIALTFLNGVLFRTKNFKPDYRYTRNFIDLWSIDEIVLIDVSKKKFQKNFLEIVSFFSKNCFVPITVGGGIFNIDHANELFYLGADKLLIGYNSLKKNRNIIKQLSNKYGNQAILFGLDCKKNQDNYSIVSESGNILEQINPKRLIEQTTNDGVGEILINSFDNDGGLLGYDLTLIKYLIQEINCPILVLGGAGNWDHIFQILSKKKISGACTQNIYHFTEESIKSAKKYLYEKKINIRI